MAKTLGVWFGHIEVVAAILTGFRSSIAIPANILEKLWNKSGYRLKILEKRPSKESEIAMHLVKLRFRSFEVSKYRPIFEELRLRFHPIAGLRREWAVFVPVSLETRDDGILAFSPKIAHLHVYNQSCNDKALHAYGTALRSHLLNLVKKLEQSTVDTVLNTNETVLA